MLSMQSYMRYVWSRSYLIVLIALAGLMLAGVYAYSKKPVYESTASIYVLNSSKNGEGKNDIEYTDLLASQLLVKNYKELIRSRSVTEQVINQLGLTDLTSELLTNKVAVELKTESNILSISVKDSDPQMAMRLANKISEVFIDKAVQLMKIKTISILDPGELPELPIGLSRRMMLVIGLLVGGMLGTSGLLLFAYFDTRIHTVEDVRERLDLPTLGIIPDLEIK